MRIPKNSSVKNSIGRLIFVLLSVIFQVSWILVLLMRLNNYSTIISLFSSFLALAVALRIYGNHTNAAFKMPWIILILSFPVLGLCIYFLFGHSQATKRMRDRFAKIDDTFAGILVQEKAILKELEKADFMVANQSRYLWKYGHFPIYRNTDVEFFAEAEEGLESQIRAFAKAEHFIFMEYHAIEDTIAFLKIKRALVEKAKQGVEIRILYDDVGSIGYINTDFIKRMEAEGIQCRVFNPIKPILNIFMNNRDHRKITVIDGKIGFTGGYNLADEYFNITHPYGYWKDTGVKLTGDAVKNLTVMFLSMWNAMKQSDYQYQQYLPEFVYQAQDTGFVQPYADSPLSSESVGENAYLNLIKSARHRLYIATPYLIISDEMTRELGMAAKRGVDLRIITPGIPDKKLIYKVTRSYYAQLARNGVRIYEYTPGFIHEKQMLCDEDTAIVGTINMDYRSLYHHFENGVLLYKCSAVNAVADDFSKILEVSQEVTANYNGKRSAVLRAGQCILRLAAPLL